MMVPRPGSPDRHWVPPTARRESAQPSTEFARRVQLYLCSDLMVSSIRTVQRMAGDAGLEAENGVFVLWVSRRIVNGAGNTMKHSAREPACSADNKEAVFHGVSELIL